jgi:hypothetical protein
LNSIREKVKSGTVPLKVKGMRHKKITADQNQFWGCATRRHRNYRVR